MTERSSSMDIPWDDSVEHDGILQVVVCKNNTFLVLTLDSPDGHIGWTKDAFTIIMYVINGDIFCIEEDDAVFVSQGSHRRTFPTSIFFLEPWSIVLCNVSRFHLVFCCFFFSLEKKKKKLIGCCVLNEWPAQKRHHCGKLLFLLLMGSVGKIEISNWRWI